MGKRKRYEIYRRGSKRVQSAIRRKSFGSCQIRSGINNVYPGDYGEYYNSSISYLLSASDGADFADRLLAGKFPQNEDEICISSYTADCILKTGLYNPETGSDDRYTLTEDQNLSRRQKIGYGSNLHDRRDFRLRNAARPLRYRLKTVPIPITACPTRLEAIFGEAFIRRRFSTTNL